MQFDLGSERTDISVVRVVGRADQYADLSSTSLSQQSNLSVWLSPTTAFQSGTLCASNLSPSVIGETLTVLCPVNASARYVTVWMNTTGRAALAYGGLYAGKDFLSLQEVTPVYDGEPGGRGWCAAAGCWQSHTWRGHALVAAAGAWSPCTVRAFAKWVVQVAAHACRCLPPPCPLPPAGRSVW